MAYRFCLSFFVVFIAILSSVYARAESDMGRYNEVSLRVSVEREVAHDLMRVTLYSEGRDRDSARLAEKTTKAINDGVVQARHSSGVTIQTGNRHAYPVYDKDGQEIVAWHERAELHLESHDFSFLSMLSSQLLGELKMAGRSFSVSQSRQKEMENILTEEAIAAFHERAQLVTKSLGGKGYKLVRLNLERGSFYAPLIQRNMVSDGMAIAQEASANVAQHIEAGSSEIAMMAYGVIEVDM